MAASATAATGIVTCAGTIPLDLDAVLGLSLVPASPFFLDFVGMLDAGGGSKEPALAVPDSPSFRGLKLHFAFLALDLSAACPIAAISEPFSLTTE